MRKSRILVWVTSSVARFQVVGVRVGVGNPTTCIEEFSLEYRYVYLYNPLGQYVNTPGGLFGP